VLKEGTLGDAHTVLLSVAINRLISGLLPLMQLFSIAVVVVVVLVLVVVGG